MHTIKLNKYINLMLLALVVLLTNMPGMGQTKNYNEEITVVAPYDPIIPDAFKISFNPAINDTITSLPVMKYNVMPLIANVRPEIEKLPAVKLVAEPIQKIYRNYLKIGAGNNASLYGELYSSSLRSKKSLIAFRLKHQSSAGKIKDYGPPKNSKNEVTLNATRFFDMHNLSGKLFYVRDVAHLYGFKVLDFPPVEKDDIHQRFFRIGGDAEFKSTYKSENKLNHAFGATYYYMQGLNQDKEGNFKLTAAIDKTVSWLKITEKQQVGIVSGYSHLTQTDSIHKFTSGIFILNPYMKAKYNEYSVMLGFKMNLGIDTVTKAKLFPVIEAKLELIPGALKLYAGISGGMERTSMKTTLELNPFINAVMPWNYVVNKFNAYGGLQSNISRSINFNASISSSTFENYPLFVTDTNATLLNTFTYVYDDINEVKIKAELELVKSSKLRLAATGIYNHYKTTLQEYAWYKPTYEITIAGRYDIQNKIILTSSATINSKVWALVPEPGAILHETNSPTYIMTAQQLKGWVDVNIGAEYRFNKALSFWLNINNLSHSRYYKWNNYRSYGINLLGGVSYSF